VPPPTQEVRLGGEWGCLVAILYTAVGVSLAAAVLALYVWLAQGAFDAGSAALEESGIELSGTQRK
jgi:hypothetical protein